MSIENDLGFKVDVEINVNIKLLCCRFFLEPCKYNIIALRKIDLKCKLLINIHSNFSLCFKDEKIAGNLNVY